MQVELKPIADEIAKIMWTDELEIAFAPIIIAILKQIPTTDGKVQCCKDMDIWKKFT